MIFNNLIYPILVMFVFGIMIYSLVTRIKRLPKRINEAYTAYRDTGMYSCKVSRFPFLNQNIGITKVEIKENILTITLNAEDNIYNILTDDIKYLVDNSGEGSEAQFLYVNGRKYVIPAQPGTVEALIVLLHHIKYNQLSLMENIQKPAEILKLYKFDK